MATVRWPRPSRLLLMSLVLAVVVGVVVGSSAFVLAALTAMGAWLVAGVRVVLHGGGFRPLRMIDLIEFNACDALDAWDQEQAAIRARA